MMCSASWMTVGLLAQLWYLIIIIIITSIIIIRYPSVAPSRLMLWAPAPGP